MEGFKDALEPLEALGVRTVLTSGRAPTAEEGLPLLEGLQASTGLGIMPGAGIGPQNVSLFLGRGFEAIHLSGLPRGQAEDFRGLSLNSPSFLREGAPLHADPERLQAVVDQVRGQGR
jgi:copper homeostasis protein